MIKKKFVVMNMKAINCPHKDKKNAGYGLCSRCYQKSRYIFDEKYRKNVIEFAKKYYRERYAKNPNWNKDKQKRYRENNRDKFNYILAKCYIRRLDNESIKKLLYDVGFYKKRKKKV